MRLYSRSQVFLLSSIALAAGALGAAAVILATRVPAIAGQARDMITAPMALAPTAVEPVAIDTVDTFTEFTQDERENIDVYERLNAGVVNVTTEVVAINWFLEPVPQEGGSGSGSVISTDGYVLTNYHVIKDAYKVFVNMSDGSRYEGRVVGSDSENDLAVIKFDPPKGLVLTVVPFGDSSGLRVGQKVLAIGNPFGLERTLTMGIVSGIGRPVQQDSRTIIRDMIQTDASINPGNSGGPLLNARGEIIGINTMIYSPSGGSVGVGFAVPVNTAKRVVPDLIKYGMVKRGWIDAEFVQLFPALLEYMRDRGNPIPVEKGLLVSSIARTSNADRAGMRGGTVSVRYYQSIFNVGGDVVTAIDGMAIASIADLYSALEDNKPGETVKVEFYRGGKRLVVDVVLSDRAASLRTD